VRLNPKGGKVNVLNSQVRYGTFNDSLLLRQVKRVSLNNCYFLKTIAVGAPGAKKRSDTAACRHHSQRLFYAEVFEHVRTQYCPRRTGGRVQTRAAVCSEMDRTAVQYASPCSTIILSGVIIRLVA